MDVIRSLLEVGLIFVIFALFAAQLPPDVNESHYLTKAKHGWDSEWCPGDLFLSSSFSHWLFYAVTGWLNSFLSLSQVAWTGRMVTWLFLAFAWQRLSWSILPKRGMAIVSATLFLLLNDRFHLAGEWVVGGYEAKGLAYGFVLLGLSRIAQAKPVSGATCFGAATAFHVLVGGWAWVAWISGNALLWAFRREPAKRLTQKTTWKLWHWLPAVVMSLIGVLPPLLSDMSADADSASAASLIYVNQRIAHHLNFSAFPSMHVARFLAMTIGLLLIARQLNRLNETGGSRWTQLFWFAAGSLSISMVGLLLSGLAEQPDAFSTWSAGMLRFYWFRLADFAVPCSLAVACSIVLYRLLAATDLQNRSLQRIRGGVFVLALAAAAVSMIVDRHMDPRPRADRAALPEFGNNWERTLGTFENWKSVCRWINENTEEDAVFITPDSQQTFKWYAGRTEVVSWKDVPQDATSMIQWRQRVSELCEPQRRYEPGLMSYSDQQLREFGKRYKAKYLLVPQADVDMMNEPTTLRQVYPATKESRSSYVLFEL